MSSPHSTPQRCTRTGEARGASRPPLCRPWPRRQHVGRRTHLAPSPPWPQSLTSRPTSRYPACLCAIRPLSGRSCKFSLWGQGGHRMRRWLSGGLWVPAEVSASCIRPPKCSRERARCSLSPLARSAAFSPPPPPTLSRALAAALLGCLGTRECSGARVCAASGHKCIYGACAPL